MTIDLSNLTYCLIGFFTAIPITYLVATKTQKNRILTETERDFERKKNVFLQDTKDSFVNDEGFQARLENEYLKGKSDGQKDELEKFLVTYQPYTDVTEEYMGMKKTAEVGYEMQLFYAQFPVGQPTRRAVSTDIKFNQEVIDKIINSEVIGTLNSIAQLMANKGLVTKVLPQKPQKKKA